MMPFAVNTSARFTRRLMGSENQPLVVIDDALAVPQNLVDLACRTPFSPPPGGFYPGLNAPLPRDYVTGLTAAVRPLMEQAFGMAASHRVELSGYFGLATEAPDTLAPIQMLPHHDSTNPCQLALVHYLPAGLQGGTGFYRQDETGFESIDGSRQPAYSAVCARQTADAGDLNRHVGPHTPGYTLIDSVDAVFNRLILYRTTSLHSGLLETSRLTQDPTTGRLTANIFIRPSQSNET